MKEKTAKLKEKIEKDYKDMMEVINSTSLPLFVEDTIEDMHILIKTLIAENKELKENSIPKSKVQGLIDEINKAYEDSKDEYGESEYYYPDYTIDKLQSLLGKE